MFATENIIKYILLILVKFYKYENLQLKTI